MDVKQTIDQAGVSQAALAAAAKVSRAAVSLRLRDKYPGKQTTRLDKKLEAGLAALGLPGIKNIRLDGPEVGGVVEKNNLQEDYSMNQFMDQETMRHFGFTADPFGPPADRDNLVRTNNLKKAETLVAETAEHHLFTAVVGDTGSGKSMGVLSALERLQKSDKYRVVFPQPVMVDRLTAAHICNAILRVVGGLEKFKNDLELRSAQTLHVLEQAHKDDRRVLLVIEEAHLLHPSTLRALKRFHEIRYGLKPLLGIVLVGQPPFLKTLNRDEARDVANRLHIVDMQPMSLDEITNYLAELTGRRLKGSDGDPGLFGAEAVRHIAAHAKYPLEVNNLARSLLVKAWELGARTITRDILTA